MATMWCGWYSVRVELKEGKNAGLKEGEKTIHGEKFEMSTNHLRINEKKEIFIFFAFSMAGSFFRSFSFLIHASVYGIYIDQVSITILSHQILERALFNFTLELGRFFAFSFGVLAWHDIDVRVSNAMLLAKQIGSKLSILFGLFRCERTGYDL